MKINLKNVGHINSEKFLREAFDKTCHVRLLRAALIRRNICLVLFIIGIISIFIAGFSNRATLTILSLFLATLALVVMTKYDTQLFFLRIIVKKETDSES